MKGLMKRFAFFATSIAVSFLAAIVCAQAPPSQASKTTYMVPMRDGVKLATDVYLPKGEGPWPAILIRTPYDKNKTNPGGATRGGYALVVQDIRGRFASEGKDMAFINDGWGEKQDGYDTVEWIAKQPWCNGKVGTMGGSYMGIAQNLLVCTRPPHLVCSYASVAASNLYTQAGYIGGAFVKRLVEGWLQSNKWHPDNLLLMRQHTNFDDYWKNLDCESKYPQAVTPMVQVGGWYDIFSQGTLNSFMILQNNGGPGAKGKQKLVMGPWTHGGMRPGSPQGDLTYPLNSKLPDSFSNVRWFEYWLKGVDNGIMNTPPVAYYVMGDPTDPNAPGNQWRTADTWPPPAKYTPYYLRSDGRLLPQAPPANEPPQTYTYDPKNPVPTRGGNNLNMPAGPMDQRPVENRPDVLLFTTTVLERPLEVTGRVKVILWASSSAIDTDFTAKLTDVYPDGRSMLVLDGIIRARHRDSMEREHFMEPGKVYRFEIDLWSTSLIFNAGHRIRVAISSSNYPRFDANPNTGRQSWEEQNPIVAKNTIYHDAERPSHILLPVIEQ